MSFLLEVDRSVNTSNKEGRNRHGSGNFGILVLDVNMGIIRRPSIIGLNAAHNS